MKAFDFYQKFSPRPKIIPCIKHRIRFRLHPTLAHTLNRALSHFPFDDTLIFLWTNPSYQNVEHSIVIVPQQETTIPIIHASSSFPPQPTWTGNHRQIPLLRLLNYYYHHHHLRHESLHTDSNPRCQQRHNLPPITTPPF